MEISDGIKFERTWTLEHYGRNDKIEKYISENCSALEEMAVRAFMYFLSDTYPATRPALFGPPKSIEEFREK